MGRGSGCVESIYSRYLGLESNIYLVHATVHCSPALVFIQSEAADSGADPREAGGPGGHPQGDAGQPCLQPQEPHPLHGVGHLVNLGKYTLLKKTLRQKIKLL